MSPTGRTATTIAAVLFALLSIQYAVLTIGYATRTPWWMDEVLALWTARQPDAGAVWRALERGAEFTPPAYDLGLHALIRFGVDSRLALRLPGILAIYAAGLAIGAVAWRRGGALPALVAAGAMLSSGLAAFAVQLRPYAFVTFAFCAALAVYGTASGRTPTRARVVVIGALLTLSVALHFYALLLVTAFVVLEMVRAYAERRTPHAPTLIAAAIAAASIMTWWPILVAARALSGQDVFAPAYYARPTLARLLESYAATLGWLTVPLAGLLLLRRRPFDRGMLDPALVLLAVPMLVFIFAAFVSHSYATRYVIVVAAGGALLFAALVQRLPAWAAPVLLAVFLAGNLLGSRGRGTAEGRDALSTVATAPGDLPIATGSGLRWFELTANAPPATRRRLVYIDTHPDASPDPTNHHQVRRWKAIDPHLDVVDAQRFLCDTPAFWLFVDPSGGEDSLPAWLRGHVRFVAPAAERPSLTLVRSPRCA